MLAHGLSHIMHFSCAQSRRLDLPVNELLEVQLASSHSVLITHVKIFNMTGLGTEEEHNLPIFYLASTQELSPGSSLPWLG